MQLTTFKKKLIRVDKNNKRFFSKKNFLLGEFQTTASNIYEMGNENIVKCKLHHESYDIKYVMRIYEIILNNLSLSLNTIHKKKNTKKYWELLIGRWTWTYVFYLISRWNIISSIEKNNKIDSVLAINFNSVHFLPSTTLHFHNMVFNDENWNSWMFQEIMKYKKKFRLIYFNLKKKNVKEIVNKFDEKILYYKIYNFFLGPRNFFFYKFLLPKKIKKIFFLSKFYFILKQYKNINKSKYNTSYKKIDRNKFYNFKETKDNFLNFANIFVKKNFPKIFLEDYNSLENSYHDLNWPKKPKYILTSLGHIYDETFKIYTAEQRKNNNTKLIVMQHGGSYGMEKIHPGTIFETKVSDRFLTWGWKNNKKHYPLFNSTIKSQENNFQFKNENKILLVLYEFNVIPTRPNNANYTSFNFAKIYIDSIVDFIEKLDNKLKKKIVLNIKRSMKKKKDFIKKSILFKHPNLKFVENSKYTHETRSKYNLQVEFYFSTGFLEAMSLNNPVILICANSFKDQTKQVVKQIQILKKRNICFDSSQKASEFINNNYNSLEEWWRNSLLQKSRIQFCKKYCKTSKTPIKDLNKSLIF